MNIFVRYNFAQAEFLYMHKDDIMRRTDVMLFPGI